MRKMYLRVLSTLLTMAMLLALLPTVAFADGSDTSVAIDETNFPDGDFRAYVADKLDPDKDGVLSQAEQDAVTGICIGITGAGNLTGISHFKNLTSLDCGVNELTELDLSQNPALTKLDCSFNQLTALDVSQNPALEELHCENNRLTTLDVGQNSALTCLNCSDNELATLDVSQNSALEQLDCSNTRLTTLDVSQNSALTCLNCSNNELATLDVSQNPELASLNCFNNQLTTLDVSQNSALEQLDCSNTRLTTLDVSQNPELTSLNCSDNQLAAMDVSQNTALSYFSCIGNQLIISLTAENTFDLSQLPGFDVTKASQWNGGKVNGNILTFNKGTSMVSYNYDCGNGHTTSFDLVSRISLYYDVNPEAWYYKAINFALSNGIFSGVTQWEFAPNGETTRAMFVAVLWRLDGRPESAAANPFVDVKAGSYYEKAVIWAAAHKIVAGADATHFSPNGNVTREQVAAFLYRYASAKGYDLSTTANLNTLPDANEVSNYARENLAWAVGSGLISGSKDTATGIVYLNPKGNATRAQVAQILMMFTQKIAK